MSMYNGLDMAVCLINMLIDKAKETEKKEYYSNFIKIHKLLFIAQCYSYAKDGKPLFESKITANGDGPYIWSMSAKIPGHCGFGQIDQRISTVDVGASVVFLSNRMKDILETVINKYGHLSTMDIVLLTKSTTAWKISYDEEQKESRNIIDPIWMFADGCQLFSEEI